MAHHGRLQSSRLQAQGLAIVQCLRRMAEAVETRAVSADELGVALTRLGLTEPPPGLLVCEIDGPMFFAAVEHFEHALLHAHTDPKTLIVRLGGVPFVDITGIQTLAEVVGALQQAGLRAPG